MVSCDANDAGFESELHVSVPNAIVTRLVDTATGLPPLEPDVLREGSYALPIVPPTALMPKSPNGNSSRLALPNTIAPPRRIAPAMRESSRGWCSASALDPPVVGNPSTSMLSLNATG